MIPWFLPRPERLFGRPPAQYRLDSPHGRGWPMPGNDMLAARLTIHLDAAVLWHHRPAYAELVHRAHREGLIGASVFRGVTGFGAGDPKQSPLAPKGPCAVVIVDEEPRLRDFLPHVADVLGETSAVAVLDRVRIHTPCADE